MTGEAVRGFSYCRRRGIDGNTLSIVKIKATGRTDTGRVRSNNEDNFVIGYVQSGKTAEKVSSADLDQGILLIVADGMGGAAAGEVAAEAVVENGFNFIHSNRKLSPERALRDSIRDAHTAIRTLVKRTPARQGMGSVATFAYLLGEESYFAQVGDSRLYRLREGRMEQITQDQSLVADLVRNGSITEEEARIHPMRNQVNQAIGPTEQLQPVVGKLDVAPGDRLLLCSDGLNGMVEDEAIADVLRDVQDLDKSAQELIRLANDGGGHDNITVIIADIH